MIKIPLKDRKTACAIDTEYFYVKCKCFQGFHQYSNNGNFRTFRKEVRYSKCPADDDRKLLIRINKATKRASFEGYDSDNEPVFTEEEFDYKYEKYVDDIEKNLFK
jgi:hypothetical protein